MNSKHHQRGAALFLALCCLAVLCAMSAAFYEGVHGALRDQNASHWRMTAACLANAGMEKALAALNANAGTYAGETDTPLGDQTGHQTTFSVEVRREDAGRFAVVAVGTVVEGSLVLGRATVEAVVERSGGQGLRVTQWKER